MVYTLEYISLFLLVLSGTPQYCFKGLGTDYPVWLQLPPFPFLHDTDFSTFDGSCLLGLHPYPNSYLKGPHLPSSL